MNRGIVCGQRVAATLPKARECESHHGYDQQNNEGGEELYAGSSFHGCPSREEHISQLRAAFTKGLRVTVSLAPLTVWTDVQQLVDGAPVSEHRDYSAAEDG